MDEITPKLDAARLVAHIRHIRLHLVRVQEGHAGDMDGALFAVDILRRETAELQRQDGVGAEIPIPSEDYRR